MKEKIAKVKEAVDLEINDFLDGRIGEMKAQNVPPIFNEMAENLRNFILRGGKRLRPFLFVQGYLLAGGDDEQKAIRASVALEFLHAGLIIQDDVMDRDSRRHGGPSIYAKYQQEYEERFHRQDLQHFGYSMAICAGDVALSWSFKIIAQADFAEGVKVKALGKLSQIFTRTVGGQMLDEISQFGTDFTEDSVYMVQKYKTALYTVVGPLQMGAIMAGAGDDELGYIGRFSLPLGIAYQIQDDILGVFGEPEETGKPVGADLREGKKTLLISYAMKAASEEDRRFIEEHLGKEDITEEDVARMRRIIVDTGSLKYSEEKMAGLVNGFEAEIEGEMGGFGDRYAPLKDFAGYLIKRKK